MKRLFSVFLICAVLLFSGCGNSENKVAPPFFKVVDGETGGVVYMLGTMHVGLDNTVYPDEVYKALDESDVLAVEIDLQELEANTAELAEAMRIMMLKDCTAEEYIGGDYEEIREWFGKKGLYNKVYDNYMPVVWSSLQSNKLAEDCGYKTEFGTDRMLLTYAKKHGKQIYEIESVSEQYQVNADEGRELQIYMLTEAVRTDYDIQKQQMNDLYSAWSGGDIAALEGMLAADEPPEELSEQYTQYYFGMYENRQKKMAEYILGELKNGGRAFVAVGALHYAAAPDIIDIVEQAGYTVEKIDVPLTE